MIEVIPVRGIGEVAPGSDLAALIAEAAPWLQDGDVLVVTSKVVSKAEGRLTQVPQSGPERDRARAEVVAAETARTVAVRGETRVVATHHGFVMASAGVDASNVDPSHLVLLPKDPDGSARALRAALAERFGRSVAVIISDTMGRPWRNGLVDTALGAAGIAPLRDYRGGVDPYGNELRLTQMAVADELAAAAELVKGKTDRVPVAVIRGVPIDDVDGPGVVATLIRDAGSDLFSLGTAEARAAGLRDAAALPDITDLPTEPVDLAAVRRAIATVDGRSRMELAPELPAIACTAADPSPQALIRLGADVHRLRAALAAEGIASSVQYRPDPTVYLTARDEEGA